MHTRAYAWILVFFRSLCIVMILNIVLVNIKGTYPGAGMFRVTASGLKKTHTRGKMVMWSSVIRVSILKIHLHVL